MYWAWSHSSDISEWTKLFDLVDEDPNFTRRIFAFISGGILPLVSLGFIKSLMDYLAPKEEVPVTKIHTNNVTEDTEIHTNTETETPNTTELNKKNVDAKLSKLGDIVDNAEKVVNSIGEK